MRQGAAVGERGAERPRTREDDRALILERTDLAALIAEHGVELRSVGDRHVGRCPFHAEKTPSFTVYADRHFHCFGCGAHGTALDFVMQQRGLDFREALRWLADRAGVSIKGACDRPSTPPAPTPRERAAAEREDVFDTLRALWAERERLTREVAGSAALERYAIEVELPELAERETALCRRFGVLTEEARSR